VRVTVELVVIELSAASLEIGFSSSGCDFFVKSPRSPLFHEGNKK